MSLYNHCVIFSKCSIPATTKNYRLKPCCNRGESRTTRLQALLHGCSHQCPFEFPPHISLIPHSWNKCNVKLVCSLLKVFTYFLNCVDKYLYPNDHPTSAVYEFKNFGQRFGAFCAALKQSIFLILY